MVLVPNKLIRFIDKKFDDIIYHESCVNLPKKVAKKFGLFNKVIGATLKKGKIVIKRE